MPDQADGLRRLCQSRIRSDPGDPVLGRDPPSSPSGAEPPFRRCRLVVVTAGKGGVGTSVVALHLALALGRRGPRVLLLDADLGTANIDLLAGLAPRFDLGDVLAGDCSLREAAVPGPGGIRVVAGAHVARLAGGRLTAVSDRLRAEVEGLRTDPELAADLVVIDAGSALRSTGAALASRADEVVVVTTPEPTAVLDTHAVLARLGRLPPAPRVGVVVNQARSRAEGRTTLERLVPTARQFRGLVVDPLGTVRTDGRVAQAVRRGRPLGVGWWPLGPSRAARDLAKLAEAVLACPSGARAVASSGSERRAGVGAKAIAPS